MRTQNKPPDFCSRIWTHLHPTFWLLIHQTFWSRIVIYTQQPQNILFIHTDNTIPPRKCLFLFSEQHTWQYNTILFMNLNRQCIDWRRYLSPGDIVYNYQNDIIWQHKEHNRLRSKTLLQNLKPNYFTNRYYLTTMIIYLTY